MQTYLPASAFTACSTNKWPENSLFRDVDATSVSFDDLKRYKPLVLALYDLSPMGYLSLKFIFMISVQKNMYDQCSKNMYDQRSKKQKLIHRFLWQLQPDICIDCSIYVLSWLGEFTTGFLEKVFLNLDQECDHNLSHGRYIRDKAKWANTEPLVEPAITDVCSFEFKIGTPNIK